MGTIVYDTEGWSRAGQGRVFQFYITDEEMATVLNETLPKELGPYSLLFTEMVKSGKVYKEVPHTAEIGDFLDLRSQGVIQFYLHSGALTPQPRLSKGKGAWVSGILGLSGLLNILMGSYIRGRWEVHRVRWTDSDIGYVRKIENFETGEKLELDDYAPIFNKLKRAIKRLLVYRTVWVHSDGRRFEWKTPKMSEAMYQKYKSGEIVTVEEPIEEGP